MIERMLQIDKELFLWMNFDGSPLCDTFFWAVSGKIIWVPLYMLIVWLLYRKLGLRDTAVAVFYVVFTVVVSDHICNFFKYYVPKFRPTHNPELEGLIDLVNNYRGGLNGTVSAHAAISFGIMTFSSVLIRARWYTVGMILWASLIAYSRIYIGAHYPFDIFFGILTGCLVAFFALKLYVLTIGWLDRRKPE